VDEVKGRIAEARASTAEPSVHAVAHWPANSTDGWQEKPLSPKALLNCETVRFGSALSHQFWSTYDILPITLEGR
jgi:hypothetical protein